MTEQDQRLQGPPAAEEAEVAPPGVNPHPHIDVFMGPEITAWPDGMVGMAWRGTPADNRLLTPDEAEAIGWALLRMARVARPVYLYGAP